MSNTGCHGCDELAEAFERATAGCGRCAHAPALNFGPFEIRRVSERDSERVIFQRYEELCAECVDELKIRERYTCKNVFRGVAHWRQWSPKGPT